MLALASSSNILVTAPFSGSHLTSISNVAVVLADNGHNVTFISLEKGSLDNFNHPNITGHLMKDTFWEKGEHQRMMSELCTAPVSLQFSEHMIENTLKLPGCLDAFSRIFDKSSKAYRSSEFENILDGTKFNVIIAEALDFVYLAAIATFRKIPTSSYSPNAVGLSTILHGNYRLLESSHPGIVFEPISTKIHCLWSGAARSLS